MSYNIVKHCMICDGEQSSKTITNRYTTVNDICIACKRTLRDYVSENYTGAPIKNGETTFNWT